MHLVSYRFSFLAENSPRIRIVSHFSPKTRLEFRIVSHFSPKTRLESPRFKKTGLAHPYPHLKMLVKVHAFCLKWKLAFLGWVSPLFCQKMSPICPPFFSKALYFVPYISNSALMEMCTICVTHPLLNMSLTHSWTCHSPTLEDVSHPLLLNQVEQQLWWLEA